MVKTTPAQNKALVLQAFDTLFNKRDYKAAERFWSPNYIQHSAHIAPGREGLFNLVKSLPAELRYEAGPIVADGEFVIVHGRFSGRGTRSPSTSCASPTASSRSIGTCCRTKPRRPNRRAAFPCSATSLLGEPLNAAPFLVPRSYGSSH